VDNLPASGNHRQHLQCSTPATSRSDLKPATAKAGTAELMACLTLVAPSGMTAEDRQAWVAVAKATLTGIPADLLARGCKKARETCRFASEIVPTIMGEARETWNWRKRMDSEGNTPRLGAPVRPPIPREETQRILREVRNSLKA
jgi:hypothetical protein